MIWCVARRLCLCGLLCEILQDVEVPRRQQPGAHLPKALGKQQKKQGNKPCLDHNRKAFNPATPVFCVVLEKRVGNRARHHKTARRISCVQRCPCFRQARNPRFPQRAKRHSNYFAAQSSKENFTNKPVAPRHKLLRH